MTSSITLRQVKMFKPSDGQDPDITLGDGSRYYGDVKRPECIPNGRGFMLYKDGSRYGGDWLEEKRHGKGVLISSLFTYEGDWQGDKMHGQGTIQYHNSNIVSVMVRLTPFDQVAKPLEYRGEFHMTHHRHGKGTMTYGNGDIYEGEWFSNRRHGQGTIRCVNGEKYVGGWANDERYGEGTINYVNGSVYSGQVVHGKRHGSGIMIYPNGDEYQGFFSCDIPSGKGMMKYRNGDVYEGEWKEGQRHGEGSFTLGKSGAVVSGNFKKGLIDGRGSVSYPSKSSFFLGDFSKGERSEGTYWNEDGTVYCGEWRGDNYYGKGTLWSSTGDFYYGTFQGSQRHGTGCENYADGSEYSGMFRNDKRHGLGILQHPNGKVEAGLFSEGHLSEGYSGSWDGVNFVGKGELFFADKSQYTGQFYRGMRHGKGIMRYSDAKVYKGDWKEDSATGSGSLRYPTGEVYVGDFFRGQRFGKGKLSSWTGRAFEGAWKQDVQCGDGALVEIDSSSPIFRPQQPAVDAPRAGAVAAVATEVQRPETPDEVGTGAVRAGGGGTGDSEAEEEAPLSGSPAAAEPHTPEAQENGKGKKEKGIFGNLFRRNLPSLALPKFPFKLRLGSDDAAAAEERQQIIEGYKPLYLVQGNWNAGVQTGRGTCFFPDGRIFQGFWNRSLLRMEVPHRGNIIAANVTVCPFCGSSFGFFRKESKCELCARPSCPSCLREHRLVSMDKNNHHHSGTSAQKLTVAPCADASLCYSAGSSQNEKNGTAFLESESSAAAADISSSKTPTPDTPNTLLICNDCVKSLVLCLVKGTLWEGEMMAYRGYIAGSAPHGDGTLWDRGTCYHGDFKLGKRHGIGTFTSSIGEEYIGEWQDDQRHGKGISRCADGTVLEAMWEHNKISRALFHGEATPDLLRHGTGISWDTTNGGTQYNGEFRDGKRHGTGCLKFSDGRVYSGEFCQNEFEGRGRLLCESFVFVGSFVKGKREGRGQERRSDGTIYTGNWKNDVMCGVIRCESTENREVSEFLFENNIQRTDVIPVGSFQPDEAANECTMCSTKFGVFYRRHHCRRCGKVFCHACSTHHVVLPKHFGWGEEPQRVCQSCFLVVSEGVSLGIRFYNTGQIYAGQWSHGEWAGRGLLKETDGKFYLTQNNKYEKGRVKSQPPQPTEGGSTLKSTEARPEQIEEFQEWWDNLVERVAKDTFPLTFRMETSSTATETDNDATLGTDSSSHKSGGIELNVDIVSFDPNAKRTFVPGVIPPMPQPPPLPTPPAPAIEPTDDEFTDAMNACQTLAEITETGYKPISTASNFNEPTPLKPPAREFHPFMWKSWNIRSVPLWRQPHDGTCPPSLVTAVDRSSAHAMSAQNPLPTSANIVGEMGINRPLDLPPPISVVEMHLSAMSPAPTIEVLYESGDMLVRHAEEPSDREAKGEEIIGNAQKNEDTKSTTVPPTENTGNRTTVVGGSRVEPGIESPAPQASTAGDKPRNRGTPPPRRHFDPQLPDYL